MSTCVYAIIGKCWYYFGLKKESWNRCIYFMSFTSDKELVVHK